MKRALSGIMLTLLLMSMLTLAFNIQPVRADPSVYVFEVKWEEIVFHVAVESNSTVSHFNFNQPMKEVGFNVTGPADTIGFCNVTIPKSLLWAEDEWTVLVDAQLPVIYTQTENTTHSMLYFTYVHSTYEIRIIGTHVIGPTTIIVPDDYPTMQEAINNANEEDTIFVRNGTYYEHVVVNKTVSLIGENRSTTIIDGNSTGTVVHIIANNVSVKGFTIQNAGSHIGLYFSGIYLDNAYNCNITRNSILSNDYGIRIRYSSNNTVSENMINCSHGIWLQWSSNNTVYGNNVTTSEWYSIWLDYSSGNAISRNIVTNGGYYGIRLYSSSNNILRKNSMAHNRYSFHITDSSHNTFSGNDIANNDYGMFLVWSANNTIYLNNFINNTLQAYSDLVNTWDNGCQGNYWSDYNGTDNNSDGIGDVPHIIDENNTDNYPLMNPYWNPGDIDHDLDVDLYDAVRLLLAYGSTPEDEHYNCHCDINEPYGAIDLFDAVLLLLNYGKKHS